MSNQNTACLTKTVAATGTINANRFVTPAGAQAGADANTLGVARSAAVSGELLPVDMLGTAVIESGAAFSKGATLKSNASGQGITWVTSGAKVAVALEAATAANQLIEVLLIPNAA